MFCSRLQYENGEGPLCSQSDQLFSEKDLRFQQPVLDGCNFQGAAAIQM